MLNKNRISPNFIHISRSLIQIWIQFYTALNFPLLKRECFLTTSWRTSGLIYLVPGMPPALARHQGDGSTVLSCCSECGLSSALPRTRPVESSSDTDSTRDLSWRVNRRPEPVLPHLKSKSVDNVLMNVRPHREVERIKQIQKKIKQKI